MEALKKSCYGTETVDEFTREANQTYREFSKYVTRMAYEYNLSGMSVYRSQRACNDWKDR